MNENNKHAPPLWCRIRRLLICPSPSAMLCKCAFGLHRRTRRCGGCSANSAEIICENLQRGFDEGLKAPPLFKISEDGKSVQILRKEEQNHEPTA